MVRKNVVVLTKTGLHARPANILLKKAKTYDSKVLIALDGKEYNAKSMVGILGAGVECGMEIDIVCNGEDEEKACNEIVEMIKSGGLGE